MLRAGLWHRRITRVVDVEPPAAGVDWTLEVPVSPEGIWWRIKAIYCILTTSAAAGNRASRFFYAARRSPNPGDVLAGAYYLTEGNTNQAPATTGFLCGAEGGQLLSAASREFILPHDFRLPPGHVVGVITTALDAADQYRGIKVVVEEWVYEEAGERTPSVGDGSDRVDAVKLNKTLERLAQLLESQTATP